MTRDQINEKTNLHHTEEKLYSFIKDKQGSTKHWLTNIIKHPNNNSCQSKTLRFEEQNKQSIKHHFKLKSLTNKDD